MSRAKDLHDAPLEERVAVEQRIWDRVRDETFADASLLNLTYPTYESFFTAYPEFRYVYDFFGPTVAGRRILELGCGPGVDHTGGLFDGQGLGHRVRHLRHGELEHRAVRHLPLGLEPAEELAQG